MGRLLTFTWLGLVPACSGADPAPLPMTSDVPEPSAPTEPSVSRQSIVVAVLGGAGALTGERAGQAGDLAGVLLLAAGTRSRRRVIESDWDHIRAAERGLLVRWAAPAQLPTGCTPEPIAIDAALLVLTGPFRRSVIVRNGNSIRSPFLVDDDALWRRVEAFAGG